MCSPATIVRVSPRTVKLFLLAAASLAGCASTRDKAAAEIQPELPQLVAACNGAFRDGSEAGLGVVVIAAGIDACDRLNHGRSLDQVRPSTADLYHRYKRQGHSAASSFPIGGPDGISPSADVGVQAWAPGMPLPSAPVN